MFDTLRSWIDLPPAPPPPHLIYFEKKIRPPSLLLGPPFPCHPPPPRLLILYIFCYENVLFLPNFENFKMRRFNTKSFNTNTKSISEM